MNHNALFFISTNTTDDVRETLTKDITLALKTLITLESQNIPTSKHIVSIITNLTRLGSEASFLTRKLFYYYISAIPKIDTSGAILAEVLLITNMLRKDLQSPNEYLRVIAMRTLRSFPKTANIKELMVNFYKPLKENLKHKNAYVRRNAIQIIKEVYDEDTSEMIIIERDDMVLRQLCISNEKYEPCICLEEMGVNLLELIVYHSTDYDFIYKAKSKLPYQCCKKLIMNDMHVDECLEILLKCDRRVDGLKFVVNEKPELLGQKVNLVINILKDNESMVSYSDLLKVMLQEDVEEVKVFISDLLRSGTTQNIVYTLKSLHESNFEIDAGMINNENPEISYEALKLLADKGIIEKINLEKIRYGKILRKAMQIIVYEVKNKVNDPKQCIEKYIKIFEKTLQPRKSKEYFLDRVFEDDTPFIGVSVAMFFESLAHLMDRTLKARSIALILRYIKRGNESGKMDMSTECTMTLCIKNMLAKKERESVEKNITSKDQMKMIKKGDALEIIPFSRKSISSQQFIKESQSAYIKDLTALSDPVYVQSSVKVDTNILTLTLTFTNLTNSLLQNLDIDLTTSFNLYPLSEDRLSFLGPNQTTKATYTFSINKITPMFICGVLVFNYMSEKKEFNKVFHLNLDEIRLGIGEFLMKGGNVDFEALWHTFEWENIYNVKLKGKETSLHDFLYFVAEKIHARILIEQGDENYLVANMVVKTMLNDSILINVLLCIDEAVCAEFRIRSKMEEVVKSVSSLIGECVKKLN